MKPDKKKDDFVQLIKEIKSIVEKSKTKLQKEINSQIISTYWRIGKIIVDGEDNGKDSSRQLIIDLSKELTKQLGKGFSRTNLFYMRQFYYNYPDFKKVSGQLSWSHICELTAIDDKDRRSFYEKESESSKWSVRELKRQINSSLFERLLLSKGDLNKKTVLKLAKEGQVLKKAEDLIKDPYVLEFLGIPENKPLLEKDLEARLIRHIENFLLELGKGFMFVGSQQRVTLGNKHDYVDMVFYNKIIRAYVLIDLKMTKLKPAYVGQMNSYLNYYKTEINEDIDNDPIGIILCTKKEEIVAEYALGGLTNQIFASRYTYYLPNKEELIGQVERALKAYDEEE